MSAQQAAEKHYELTATWRDHGPDAAYEKLITMHRDDLIYMLMMHTGSAAVAGSADSADN